MAGVQVAGLVSGLNWQSIITQLVAIDSAGMNHVQAQQTTVNNQVSALGSLNDDLTNLEDSIFSMENPDLYSAISANSTTAGSTWTVDAASGTAAGSYAINVQRLATTSQLQGANDISQGINSSDVVSGLTVASIATAQPITAGTFTVNGAQITITTAESLQDVFDAIHAATGNTVTGGYDPASDKITLTSTSGPVILGAANDSSNFLTAMKLENDGSTSVSSLTALGTIQTGNPIVNSGLATALSGLDGSGNGSFTVNGATISYNANTDSIATVLGRINNSTANVSANYDAINDRIMLTNKTTGNLGVSVSDTSGNLAAALGLTSGGGGTLVRGVNAQFSVNGGPTESSQSNLFTANQLGVTGLTVTANTTGTQTIQVATDTTGLMSAIQTFISNFNQYQTDSASDTVIGRTSTGAVTTSILSANHEVGDWASSLQMTVFGAGSGVTSGINSLDDLGIDFSGTSGQLEIVDSAKLQTALSQNTKAVASFFQTAKTGFGSVVAAAVTDTIGQIAGDKQNFENESQSLGSRITTMQASLAAEQAKLTAEFTAMEDAESKFQSEMSALGAIATNNGSSSSSSSSSASTAGSSISNSNIYVNGVSSGSSSSSTG